MANKHNVKKGDKITIVAEHCGHEFEIGQTVVVNFVGDYDIHAVPLYGGRGWYLREDEYIPYAGYVRVEFTVTRKDLERAYEILGMERGGYGTYKAIQKALGKDW